MTHECSMSVDLLNWPSSQTSARSGAIVASPPRSLRGLPPAMGEMAGLKPWCEEAARSWSPMNSTRPCPRAEQWSEVDFTVEHLEPSDEPNVLGRLGGYDVLEIIGRGGMGVVLKAFDRELNRYVAIKVLAPHLAASSLAKKRFAREAQAAAAVVHPNVWPSTRCSPTAGCRSWSCRWWPANRWPNGWRRKAGWS